NVENLEGSLQNLTQIQGKSYQFKADKTQELHFGVIAQELQELFPHLVKKNQQGYLSVNYLELIPVLIEAIKEQQILIEQLTTSLKEERGLGEELKASVTMQQRLLQAQQVIMEQLQADKQRMEKDIQDIKHSLGLEAVKE
ncbi:MAG: tail fiber domain-containing protein, partial [Cyclobacteriaceae bacterium]|nr:tail fiber domain-containing protein [Cyclobacteriaceae bacterium]